jgi:hypothetical protein
MLLAACGKEEHRYASKRVQDRADGLLASFVQWCSHKHNRDPADRAAFEKAVDPFASLALRRRDEVYPSFLSESEDVKFGDLLQRWARWCRWRGGAALRLEAAAHRL